MHIDITGQHMEITSALHQYMVEKLSKLEKHLTTIHTAHVVMKIIKTQHHIEAKIPVNGSTLFANAAAADMYSAIDFLVDKLDRQACKHKEKHVDHHHQEGRKSALYSAG